MNSKKIARRLMILCGILCSGLYFSAVQAVTPAQKKRFMELLAEDLHLKNSDDKNTWKTEYDNLKGILAPTGYLNTEAMQLLISRQENEFAGKEGTSQEVVNQDFEEIEKKVGLNDLISIVKRLSAVQIDGRDTEWMRFLADSKNAINMGDYVAQAYRAKNALKEFYDKSPLTGTEKTEKTAEAEKYYYFVCARAYQYATNFANKFFQMMPREDTATDTTRISGAFDDVFNLITRFMKETGYWDFTNERISEYLPPDDAGEKAVFNEDGMFGADNHNFNKNRTDFIRAKDEIESNLKNIVLDLTNLITLAADPDNEINTVIGDLQYFTGANTKQELYEVTNKAEMYEIDLDLFKGALEAWLNIYQLMLSLLSKEDGTTVNAAQTLKNNLIEQNLFALKPNSIDENLKYLAEHIFENFYKVSLSASKAGESLLTTDIENMRDGWGQLRAHLEALEKATLGNLESANSVPLVRAIKQMVTDAKLEEDHFVGDEPQDDLKTTAKENEIKLQLGGEAQTLAGDLGIAIIDGSGDFIADALTNGVTNKITTLENEKKTLEDKIKAIETASQTGKDDEEKLQNVVNVLK